MSARGSFVEVWTGSWEMLVTSRAQPHWPSLPSKHHGLERWTGLSHLSQLLSTSVCFRGLKSQAAALNP